MTGEALGTRSLGRYELLYMLGQGGMGEVHLAKLTGAAGFEKLCIVKTILPQVRADPQFVERFHHEARVLVQLTHSNIAQVYDMGEVDGTLYMAIEYVAGVDLGRIESRVRKQATLMPVPIALYLGQQMCEALGYAHRKAGPDGAPLGIVHRDVSPQNVMVSYEGELKVIDFGLAKSAARSKHTLPSTVLGKLGYMSPEQALALPVDHKSDIYSAGIVVWELLAGRPIFQGGTMAEMVAKMANPTVPSLRTVRDDVSPALDQAVMRALAKDPAARYARADDFARALNELAVREQVTVGAEEVGNYVRALCPEEFAAERKLQSQLSVLRKKGSSSPAMAVGTPTSGMATPHPAGAEGLEGTFVRPSSPGTQDAEPMTPAQRAMSVAVTAPKVRSQPRPSAPGAAAPTEEPSVPVMVPRSRAPFIVLGVVAVVVVGGAGAWWYQSQKEQEPKADPLKLDPIKPLPEVAVGGDAGAPEPVAAAAVDAGATEAPAAAPARELVDVEGAIFKVLKKGDEYFIILEKKQKLGAGDRLALVGGPIAGSSQRERLGSAAVLEKRGSLASLLLDEGTQLPDKLFAVRDASQRVAARANGARDGKGRDDGKGKDDGPGRDTPPEPVAVSPGASPGAKLGDPKEVAAVQPATPPANPQPTTPPTTQPAPQPNPQAMQPVQPVQAPAWGKAPAQQPQGFPGMQITGRVTVTNPLIGGRDVVLQNYSPTAISGCEVRMAPNVVGYFPTLLRPRDTASRGFDTFKGYGGGPPDPQFEKGWALVSCREGRGYFWVVREKR